MALYIVFVGRRIDSSAGRATKKAKCAEDKAHLHRVHAVEVWRGARFFIRHLGELVVNY